MFIYHYASEATPIRVSPEKPLHGYDDERDPITLCIEERQDRRRRQPSGDARWYKAEREKEENMQKRSVNGLGVRAKQGR